MPSFSNGVLTLERSEWISFSNGVLTLAPGVGTYVDGVLTLQPVLTIPTGFTATPLPGIVPTIRFRWNKVPRATEYAIRRRIGTSVHGGLLALY